MTAFHLMEKLSSVGVNLNIYTLYSLCSKLENISISNHLISLIEPSPSVLEYNETYLHVLENSNSLDETKQRLQRGPYKEFAEIDCRLSNEAFMHENEETKAQSDLLDTLVEEFSF